MSVKKALNKGYELVQAEQYEACLSHVSRAIEIFHDDPDLYSLKGEAHFKLNQFEPALINFNKAAQLEPENPFRYSSRAFLRDAMGDTKGAVEDYKIAYQLDPEDATILNNLGVLEEKLGYKEAAQRKFNLADELYKLDPNTNIEPAKEIEEEKPQKKESYLDILGKLLTDKTQRSEFIRFIKNGFKLK